MIHHLLHTINCSAVWVLVLLVGCSSSMEKPESVALATRVSIDVVLLGPDGKVKARGGRYRLESGGEKRLVSNLDLPETPSISALSVARRSARLLVEMGEQENEVVSTPEGATVKVHGTEFTLSFIFNGSDIPPFPPTVSVGDQFTVYSLSVNAPNPVLEEFRNYPVMKKRSGASQSLAGSLAEALSDEKSFCWSGADCVQPDFGIRAQIDNHLVDIRISYECGWMHIFDGEQILAYGFKERGSANLRHVMETFLAESH